MKKLKYLITGGAGFIGSHLSEALLKEGHLVTIIDDLSTGSLRNIEAFKNNNNFIKHIDTILNEKLLSELIKESDFVFHLAAAVGVKYIIDNALHSLTINTKGTELVLHYTNKHGNKPVLIASTSEVYGKNENIPFKETDDRLQGSTHITRWGYACSKAFDEFLTFAYHRERKLPAIIVRLFNTCGPRQSGQYGMVIPRFVGQALKNQEITVYGDGSQTRSYGEVFNIGNDQPLSVKNLAIKIIELTNSKSQIKFVPYDEAYEKGFEDMKQRVPDISKIKKFIGYEPKVNVEDLLKSVIADKQFKMED